MMRDTWEKLDNYFAGTPESAAAGGDIEELRPAIKTFGVAIDADYIAFVRRFGGAQIGPYPVYGLLTVEAMGNDFADVVDLNRHFREQRWPAVEKWFVFSFDLSGNPIGLDDKGRVWLSDHDYKQVVCVEPTFEAFLRRWCLELEPHSPEYLAQEEWPRSA